MSVGNGASQEAFEPLIEGLERAAADLTAAQESIAHRNREAQQASTRQLMSGISDNLYDIGEALAKTQAEEHLRLFADEERIRRQTEQSISEDRARIETEINVDAAAKVAAAQAEAAAKATAAADRENEELHRRQADEAAKRDLEKQAAAAAQQLEHTRESIRVLGKTIGQGVFELLTNKEQLGALVGAIALMFLSFQTAKQVASVVAKRVDAILGKPTLVRETSRSLLPSRNRYLSAAKALQDVILEPKLHARISSLATATQNTKKNKAPYRNMCFYGPPGTGKTLVGRKLAEASGLDYAIMSGGDIAPLGSDAVSQLHALFEWSKTSQKGVLIFIDEVCSGAQACLSFSAS